jgi:transposase InsO family protein
VVTAGQRREAARQLQEAFEVSERRACRVLGQPRSTQRQKPKVKEDEGRLVARMLELVRQHPRYGYRRIWALLRREGWRVNRKRVHRLWRQQGLKVPRKQRKKRRLGSSANSCVRRPAERKDHVWAWDFLHDRTSDGGPLKWFTLVDEYTRECLALEVRRGMTAKAVSAVLAAVVKERGVPAHIRSDNGPEFIARAIRAWMSTAGLEALYIEPGAPWENGYAESFNSKVRDELLNAEEFASLLEARVLAGQWKQQYNHVRPHSSLGYRTPAEYGKMAPPADSAALRRPEEPSVTVDPTLTAPGT